MEVTSLSNKKNQKVNLLLREDQLLSGAWAQQSRSKPKKTPLFGDANDFDFFNPSNKRNTNGEIKVGMGKQNPNARKGRERRGKKKRN